MTVAALAVATYTLPGLLVNQMLKADARLGVKEWSVGILSQLTDSAKIFRTQSLTEADAALLWSIPRTSDVERLDLLSPEGLIFWSTDSKAVGTFLDRSRAAKTADAEGVSGFFRTETRQVEADDTGVVEVSEQLIAQIEVPVQLGGSRVGAMEVHRNKTREHRTFVDRVTTLMTGVTVFAGCLFGGLGFMIHRDSRRRLAEVRALASKEHDMMAEQLALARDIRLLGELNEWLQSSRSLDELFGMVGRFMTHLLPQIEGSIYVYSNSRDVLDGCAGWNGGSYKAHIHPDECWGLRRGRTYSYGQGDVDFVCTHADPHDGRPYLCFPILAHGETVGLMHLIAKAGVANETFNESRKLAQMCAEQISLAIANVRMRDELHDQSVRDPLTGLYNRRHLTDTLRKHLARTQKTGAPLAVISIDVDHFKRFNDNHGHDAGDMVLRAVGSVLVQNVDGDEIACRMGGEELMLLLPGADRDAAMVRAELVRAAVASIAVRYGEKTLPRVTISVGVSIAPGHGTLPQDLIRMADDALYAAKAAGRNQVVLAGQGDAAPDTCGAGCTTDHHGKPKGMVPPSLAAE
jgi:diguanylate cyclase (GGDEF)-like protein